MIQLDQLSKRYTKNDWALRDVSLTIGTGMYGLLGPNGAGKTTLMRIVATLIPPTSGEVSVYGHTLKRPEDIRKVIGYLPQSIQFYPSMTGRELLDYVGVMKGIRHAADRRKQVQDVLEQVHLTEKASAKVRTYSGGMKRRLGIASALLGNPQLLIVDEPTAGLDPEERVRFRNLLSRFSVDRTVLLSTHIVADIETSCESAAVLSRGQLAFRGPLRELQRHADGKVWEMEVTERELALLPPHRVVASRREGAVVRCTIVAEQSPGLGAVLVPPSVEAGYLALLGGERDG
ncbi:ABC transporter ATP-binding protein [Paenibacillus sp. J31TS4]|uniref:ABC transporter ATP-binding protein n=1 Tax=Paenibacillus sp. J31TS4 TaxID=2807195 RepID=UPI001B112E84|nr:ABC transporter ATP-binding protein [Paenibacillus sp. J31TS4]GIP36940.1 ABC transporter ATP-binding protein [Paenibacillus sp. J31TS4]